MWSKSQAQGDEDYLDGVALNLHGFYSGAERIFEMIAREVDGAVPSGREWHRDLLAQMSTEIAGRRPPVFDRETRACLDEYRGFRHVVRSTYAFRLRASRLEGLVADLPSCHRSLTENLLVFCRFLEQLPTGEPQVQSEK